MLLICEAKELSQQVRCEIYQDLYGFFRNVQEQRIQKRI